MLLIEPDARAAVWIGEMLRASWGGVLTVSHAERVAEGTQRLLGEAVCCVLLAISRPLAAARDAMDQIRTAAPDVAIVLLAEGDDHHEALAAIRAGAQDCLVKTELYPALLRRAVRYAIERKRAEVELAHQALHDAVTGLPNRALFLDRLGVALDRSRRTNGGVAVMFLDLDNFKQINDSFGHFAGDRLLVALADRLKTLLRPMDTVARFGGDEFTLLFEELTNEREVVAIAERISDAARLPVRLDERQLTITVSIGIAMVTDPEIAPETVIREADAAMYRAKEHGRARYELFDEVSRRRAMERLELETALRHAIDREELRVHYQPRVTLSGRVALTGLEALVRWQHPERGLIGPSEFIPLAEETGLMVPIGRYVLERALAQVARWRRRRPDMTVSVNVSFRQLEDMSLVPVLAAAMRATGTDPEAICLEITETAALRNQEAAISTLQALKAMGVRLAIDDFGSGSSSLASLKRLPIDMIKIHESVVSALGSRPEEAPVVGAVVELGHALGLSVVAEGVETEQQLVELRALGCDGAQGFLFSRPVPEEEVDELVMPARSAAG